MVEHMLISKMIVLLGGIPSVPNTNLLYLQREEDDIQNSWFLYT